MITSQVVQLYKEELKDIYEDGELSQIIFLVFEKVKSFTKIDFVLKGIEAVNGSEEEEFKRILVELKQFKPVQYVLGYAWFHEMKFNVNENVLIPRQETEELVEWIVKDTRGEGRRTGDEVKILDVCTGSGCIAVSLKKDLNHAQVTAIDISEAAIDVAMKNSETHKAPVRFIQTDILNLDKSFLTSSQSYNIIVSNPPYILESEKQQMQKKELDYEPHLAFFVKDNDALIFYKRIAELALIQLKPNGRLYFEINESKGKEVVELLQQKGFSNVILKKDLNGKDRMIKATIDI